MAQGLHRLCNTAQGLGFTEATGYTTSAGISGAVDNLDRDACLIRGSAIGHGIADALWEQATQGEAAGVLISGEPGVG